MRAHQAEWSKEMSKLPKPTLVIACVAVFVLTGCIDRASYETEPVQVKSKKGVVTCQLYTRKRVLWDEAISIPKGMTIAEGDQICQNEGLRRLGKT